MSDEGKSLDTTALVGESQGRCPGEEGNARMALTPAGPWEILRSSALGGG
jgi:hypothetical protein